KEKSFPAIPLPLQSSAFYFIINRLQKLFVCFRMLQPSQETLCKVVRVLHRLSDHPHFFQVIFGNEQLFFSRAGAHNINRWENSSFSKTPVKMQFHIPGPFKFFINDIIYAGTGIDQGCRKNRQTAAFFDIASCSEKTLRAMESSWVDS